MRTRKFSELWLHLFMVFALIGTMTGASPSLVQSTSYLVHQSLPLDSLIEQQRALASSGKCSIGPSGPYRTYLPLVLKNKAASSAASVHTIPLRKELSPNPSIVAPPLDRTVATDIYSATQFLYLGENPVQFEVSPDVFDPERAAVLRGRVFDHAGSPLPGVLVEMADHPEYGCTFSRTDGLFDLVVNGGGLLTVRYQKQDFLPVQRQVAPPWRDYAWLEDVSLIPYDSQGTVIDLSEPLQVARGSMVTDSDGSRQATLLFPQDATASMVMPGGFIQAMSSSSFTVRATEYTVGDNGPEAMPGELPPNTGYTYAVEFSIDEAVATGALDVQFDRPVVFYLENFLDFPVGGIVPVGYYDREKAAWIPSNNGRIVEILGINGDRAELDVDGTGIPADPITLEALGITDAERERLATLYYVGQSLWRVTVAHFSPWDCNWPYGPPSDARAPAQPPPEADDVEDDFCILNRSIIECQNQILGETARVVGTPFTLNYRSDRVPGRTAANRLNISLSGDSVPPSVKRIELQVEVAGQSFAQSFPPLPNQSTVFTWNGQDAYGRALQGAQTAAIRIGYVYDAVYQEPAEIEQSFGQFSGIPITTSRARQEITLWQEQSASVGAWDAHAQGLGGWTLDVHHAYDPVGRTLYLGNGERRSADKRFFQVISTVAGNGNSTNSGDGGLAVEAGLSFPNGVALGPDGSLYIAGGHRVRKVDANGVITTVAGTGACCNFPYETCGDGGLATSAKLCSPGRIAIGPEGSLYIPEGSGHRVRRVGVDGIITTVAGTGYSGYSGDGGLATEAQLNGPTSAALAPDGSLYIVDSDNNRIRRVGTNGIITTVAGNGDSCYSLKPCGDGGPATDAAISWMEAVALAPDGSFYISTYDYLRHVGTDGIITSTARLALVWQGGGIAFGLNGDLYVTYYWGTGGYVYRINPDGTRTRVAGSGGNGFSGDGGPAAWAEIAAPNDVAVGADGSLYVADSLNYRIRRVGPSMPGFSLDDFFVASSDGSEIYHFSASGKHLRTLNALTGEPLYQFYYDSDGLLFQVKDGDGNITVIQRDAQGTPLGIAGPYGQQTSFILDSSGYIASIINPVSESTQFTYTSGGLLIEVSDARSNVYEFTYDPLGRLVRENDPADGYQVLGRTSTTSTYLVTHSNALSRTSTYLVEDLQTGGQRQLNTFPDGTRAELLIETDGSRVTTLADGTVVTLEEGPDPRWDMQAAVARRWEAATPGGLALKAAVTRTVALTDPLDLLSLAVLTETMGQNGRIYTQVFDVDSRTHRITTPEGRLVTATIDSLGRVVLEQVAGLYPVTYTYDVQGHLVNIRQGTGAEARVYQLDYDSKGNLSAIGDPLGRQTDFVSDAAGRVITQTLPDGRQIYYDYDANGNVTAITPPGRPVHRFEYTPVDLQSAYDPPEIGLGTHQTLYTYNADRQLVQVDRPDGRTVDLGYDSSGRLASLTLPRGTNTYTYVPTTGQLATIMAPDGGTLSYAYDGLLLTSLSWSGDITDTVAYGYDNDFRVAALSVNHVNTVTYHYDGDGLLIQAGDLTLAYDDQNGLPLGSVLGNVTDTWDYNGFAEPVQYGAAYNGVGIYAVQYTRDRLGRVTERVETIGGITDVCCYTYDLAGRLAYVWLNGSSIGVYTYDSNGNRLSYNGPSGTVTGVYDNQDRLLQYGATTYTYTANGELVSKTVAGQTTTYDYDVLGNLMGVALPGGTQVTYLVDGANRHIGKQVDGTLVQGFLYQDGINPIAELDRAGHVVSRFVYGSRDNVPDYMIRDGSTYRIIADHLGSPRLVVNVATGTVVQRIDYDAFGNVLSDSNPGFQPFGFAGGLYDPDTKLVRFGARDYDAETGRWTAKDLLLFDGSESNLYAYVGDDPINMSDPLGLLDPNYIKDWLRETREIHQRQVRDIPNKLRKISRQLQQQVRDISPEFWADRISDIPLYKLPTNLRELVGDWIYSKLSPLQDSTPGNLIAEIHKRITLKTFRRLEDAFCP